jgi:Uma2 family endonuclease
MIQTGILTKNDPIELIEGCLVQKLPRGPLHDTILDGIRECLSLLISAEWRFRIRSAITTLDSEPEPDVVVAIGPSNRYSDRHPAPDDIALVIEVADSSILFDREIKGRVYARAGIVGYWVVNLKDRIVEAYTDPSGEAENPAYSTKRVYRASDVIELRLGELGVVTVPAKDLLP